jgi:acyl-CoA thioesterase I
VTKVFSINALASENTIRSCGKPVKLTAAEDLMSTRSLPVSLVVSLLCTLSAPLASQAPAPAPATVPATGFPGLDRYRASRVAVYSDDYGERARYRAANAALPSPSATENRVVFFGDSITDGWRLDQSFPGKPYVNRGIGGQTTSQMLVRFRQDVIDLRPRVVVILAGTNDIAGNTGPIANEEIEGNLASLTDLARMHAIRVVLSSVIPVHNYTPRAQEFFASRPGERIVVLNRWMREYTAATGVVYLDYYSAMVDDRGMLRRDLAEDGLHPNATGYAIMARLADEAIQRALTQVRRTP